MGKINLPADARGLKNVLQCLGKIRTVEYLDTESQAVKATQGTVSNISLKLGKYNPTQTENKFEATLVAMSVIATRIFTHPEGSRLNPCSM